LPGDPHPIWLVAAGGSIETSAARVVRAADWNAWAARLTAEVRRVHPESVVFVSGVDWAFDLRQIQVDAPNIVYSTHIYPSRSRRSWRRAFGRASEVPVFAGEWGGHDGDLSFGRHLIERLRRDAAGWTAWSWVDDPPLVLTPRAPNYRPSRFGELVRDELAGTAT
jgi:hypothetical protein